MHAGRFPGDLSVPCSSNDAELRAQNGCEGPHGKDSILGQSSGASDPRHGDGDFKIPMNPRPNMLSPPDRVQSTHLEVNAELPQKTPERQLLSTTEVGMQEVRKRSIHDSPAAGVEDPKRRNVSKTLDFGSESGSASRTLSLYEVVTGKKSGAARCLFGTPAEEDNDFVMREFQERVMGDYERFANRYIIVDDNGEDLVPSPYYTN